MHTKLDVNITSQQNYPVYIAHDLTESIQDCFKQSYPRTDRAIAVIDARVNERHRLAYQNLFESIFNRIDWYIMPVGETEKKCR